MKRLGVQFRYDPGLPNLVLTEEQLAIASSFGWLLRNGVTGVDLHWPGCSEVVIDVMSLYAQYAAGSMEEWNA